MATIIFEGLNCVGKSSLIKQLQPEGMYVHNNRADFLNVDMADATYGYMKAIIDVLNFSKTEMWIDRFHFTEYAYGVVLREYDEYTASKMFAEVDYRLSELGNVKLVYLYDDVVSIYKRAEELRGWGDINTFKELNERIERCVDASCLPIHMVRYSELQNDPSKMNRLMEFLKGE